MTPSLYVSRINQIDAAQLDIEIYKILKDQVKKIAEHGLPGKINKWQAEIDVLLKLLIWKASLQEGSSTFGQKLLNLHYANLNRKKAVLYLILSILPQYLKAKVTDYSSTCSATARGLQSLVDWTSNAFGILEYVNLLLFLHRGIQPRVIEFLLNLSSQSITTHRPRNIGYSYMTRELLWYGLMELFTIGIPMINFHYLKHAMIKLWRPRHRRERVQSTLPVMTTSTKCAYCNKTPILPMHAGCEHIFCYYCLQAHFIVTSVYNCPNCDAELYSEDSKMYVMPASDDDEESDDSFEKIDSG